MKTMKRLVAMLVAAIMLISFAACSSDNGKNRKKQSHQAQHP